MKHVHKSVLLWHSAQQMYDLVTQVSHYPQFLPWCDRAEVLALHDDGVTARLGMVFSGLKQSFTTRNTHEPGQRVVVQLVDGPFSLLEGHWTFKALQDDACRVELDLRYALRAGPLESVLSPVFDKVANTLVDSFVQRAGVVYGH